MKKFGEIQPFSYKNGIMNKNLEYREFADNEQILFLFRDEDTRVESALYRKTPSCAGFITQEL